VDRLADTGLSAASFADDVTDPPPSRAEVVIVGGGIIGSSIAYHLALEGITDVVVCERHTFTSGTTWHAAGLIAGARGTITLTELAAYGRQFYATLGAISGLDVGFTAPGSLSLARNPARADELAYAHDVADHSGIEARMVDAAEAQRLWPLLDPANVVAGLHFPGDGYVNPGYAALGLAKAAHALGVHLREHCPVTSLEVHGHRVVGVRTDRGSIAADRVILAGGLWTRDLAATVGVAVPLYAAEHVHVRSQAMQVDVSGLPVLRDVDNSYYIRPEGHSLLLGAFEPRGLPRAVDTIPADGHATFAPNWEHISDIRSAAERAVSDLSTVGYDRFINAPESFTPDTAFIVGETAEIDGLFVAAGMNSQGIIYAPGVGREIARWVLAGHPCFDSSAVDVTRFSPHQANRRYLHERTRESLGRLYAMHWPGYQSETARGLRRMPLHERHIAHGAVMGELQGLERPLWFGAPALADAYDFRRPGWHDVVGREHRMVRESVGIIDLSGFAKFEVSGPGALDALQYAATACVDLGIDRATYTLFLNEGGGIEADGTVTRLGPDRFWVVTPTSSRQRMQGLLRRRLSGHSATVVDRTSGTAVLGVFGPRSRELLARVSPDDWSADAQRYFGGRRVEIAGGFAYALRVSFTGELGFEIYCDADLAGDVLDDLLAAGEDLEVGMVGYLALDSLRLEKGYRHLGHDMGPADDPVSVGLDFAVAWDRGDFAGRSALDAQADRPRSQVLHVALRDPDIRLWGEETVYVGDEPVGRLTSGGYGYTLGHPIGLALVRADVDLDDPSLAVRVRGTRHSALARRTAFYDPEGARLRA
jgi:glycine cleavage system aminomethyltransferase T/glycine/D-amino acid oxidase-like deaminating enzyme